MCAQKTKPPVQAQHGELQSMYPAIWGVYKERYGKRAIPAEVWGFFHDMHVLQTARSDSEVQDAVWALSVLAGAVGKAETRRSTNVARALIRALPTREHEAWYRICQTEGFLDDIVSAHSNPQAKTTDPSRAARTALAIGVILQDFQARWASLLPWQREFLDRDVGTKSGEVLKEAQQIIDVMDKKAFSFMFSRHLIRAGDCSLALKLIRSTPAEVLAGTIEYGDPREKHSYFELYTLLVVYGDGADFYGFLNHFVRVGAYSDASLLIFLEHEDLKDVVAFVLHFVSCVRRQQLGITGGMSELDPQTPPKRSCCSILRRPKPPSTMPLRTSNVPHVLLEVLLDRYSRADTLGRERLLHDKSFQQAFEVVLLLSESDLIVRMADRLSDGHQESLRVCLRDWARLHFLRILERNRPPTFDANAASVMRLISGKELWTWTATEKRNHYFKSAARASEDVAVVICMFFELSMFLDSTIIKHLISDAQSRSPPLSILDSFLPPDSSLFDAVSWEVSKYVTGLAPAEVKLLMRSAGFYEPGIQGFCRSSAAQGPRTVFHEDNGFIRLVQAVAKLSGFRNGKMDKNALESSLGQITNACNGDHICCELMLQVVDATLKKQEGEFLPVGSEDVESDPSAFTVASLAACAKRLREACDTVRNQSVQLTFGKVIHAFLETPPRGWVPLFNSLETVLFFLRFMEREDLGLAYEKFEAENADVLGEYSPMRKLLDRARKYYKEPFIDIAKDVTDLCNLDLRTKLSKKLLPAKKRGNDPEPKFDNGDWNTVVEIALCAAESMKEKYNVPMLPHHTQMITLLMFAIQACQGPSSRSGPKTMLARVGTGEGKSWIIGMLAAFVARRGLRAHVVIDNDTLLERDYATMSGLFKKLKLRAEKKKLDASNQIVYCSAMDIEIQCLRNMQEATKEANLKDCVMIVDEVDSLIVDENVYTCYVDHHDAGSEVAEWWWAQGKDDNAYSHPPWKRKIMSSLEAAEREMKLKHEGKHYVCDYNLCTIWALDERTCHVKRSVWYLWLELLRKTRLTNYSMRYNTRQSVICKQSCFSSYSYIFGLTGSLGTEAERRYTKKHFNANCFMVPNFLDTCQGQSRPRPKCIMMQMAKDAQAQVAKTVEIAREYCGSVPILVVSKDPERVQHVSKELRRALPLHELGDRLGPGVVELVDRPGQEGEFQQMVEIATQPLETGDKGERSWRVTVTTAVGARGQDYHISDELVDEKGGFLLILEYVPDSEREWIQFLGRTARHDHPGQYAVVLNAQDYRHVFGTEGNANETSFVKSILDYANSQNEQKLLDSEVQISRGVLMHKYTAHWWSWSKRHKSDYELWQEQFGQWVELCERFETQSPDEIVQSFDALNLVLTPRATDTEPWEPQANDFDDLLSKRTVTPSERTTSGGRRGTQGERDVGSRSARSKTSKDSKEPDDANREADPKAVVSATPRSCMTRRQGDGRRIFPDGRVYSGQFAQGLMSGEGQLTWPNGQVYNGQFRDDELNGTGTLKWPDGRSYTGEWERGRQHGHGTFVDAQGGSWTGQWVDGKRANKKSTTDTSALVQVGAQGGGDAHGRV